MQSELFLQDQYGVAKCPRCGSVGTVVQMGVCCRVQRMLELDSAADKSEPGGSLSSKATTSHKEK